MRRLRPSAPRKRRGDLSLYRACPEICELSEHFTEAPGGTYDRAYRKPPQVPPAAQQPGKLNPGRISATPGWCRPHGRRRARPAPRSRRLGDQPGKLVADDGANWSQPAPRPGREKQPRSTNLKSVFTPVPLPRGCHATRARLGSGGTNRDSIPTQAFVVTAGSRNGEGVGLLVKGFESPFARGRSARIRAQPSGRIG